MPVTLEELRKIPKLQNDEQLIMAIINLINKIDNKEQIRMVLEEYVNTYRQGQKLGNELGELKLALEQGSMDIALALLQLPDGSIVGRRRSGSLEKFPSANGFKVNTGDPIYICQGIVTGVGDKNLLNFLTVDEGKIIDVLKDGKSAKVDYGPHGGTQISTLCDELTNKTSELKAGTTVLGSKSYNMLFRIADAAPVIADEYKETEKKLGFAGFYEYRQNLGNYLINPMTKWDSFDGLMPIVLVIAGTTGLGKTHGVLWAMQQVSMNLGVKANVLMLSAADLRSEYFSLTERKVKDAFDSLIPTAKNGIPSLLLLNEGEITVGDRLLNLNSSVRSTLNAVVGTILAVVDEWRVKYIDLPLGLVITTNYSNDLDVAFLNDHRMTRMITLDYPETSQEIQEIVAIYVPEVDDKKEIAERMTDKLMSSQLIKVFTEHGVSRDINLGEMCSPALISAIFQEADRSTRNESISKGKRVNPTWKHYEESANQRIKDLSVRLQDTRIANGMLPARIKDKMGRIVKVQPIYC